MIIAAGGVVYNDRKQLLMIFRNGIWDLPKGKIEVNENIRDCAIREVMEETGVENLEIVEKLQDTYHTYSINNQDILKKTYWFRMQTNYSGNLKPQISEGIEKVCWMSSSEILSISNELYGNIKDLIQDEIT